MKIALGCDHHGHAGVVALADHLEARGDEVRVLGSCDGNACDYTDDAWLVARAVADREADRGILICGSGIGVSMAANKVPGVRAAVVHDVEAAQGTRAHNDANVLCLSGQRTPVGAMPAIVDAFLATPFDGGRHARRVNKLAAIERGEDPRRADGQVSEAAAG